MLEWIASNLVTIALCTILAAVVVSIVVYLVKSKKKGKTTCGCGCANCAMSGVCHKK